MNPTFGRYEPLFKLAAGGMAEVYVARIRGEAGFEKLVAVKRMLSHLAEDERFVEMFLDEGRVAAHVSSPNVVQTLDLGRADDGALYIVMELVLGLSLSSLLKAAAKQHRPVPLPVAIEVLAQASQGLDDAHEARTPTGVHLGIVHRDVSPQNVLVGIDGRARVTDFGIARALLRRVQTSTGELKGKFSYFSPEQARGLEVDRRSDVFAMGIVAWEVLSGRRLFDGETPMESMEKVRGLAIPPPASLRPDVSREVSDVIMRALERDRETRFQTAGDFASALRNASGPMPTSREIGNWVKATSGELLSRVQDRIDGALAAGDAQTEALVDVQVISSSGTPSRAALHFAQTAVKRSGISVTPLPVASSVERRSVPFVPIGAGVVLLVVLAVAAIAFAKIGPFAAHDVTAMPIQTPVAQPPVAVVAPSVPAPLAPIVLSPIGASDAPPAAHASGGHGPRTGGGHAPGGSTTRPPVVEVAAGSGTHATTPPLPAHADPVVEPPHVVSHTAHPPVWPVRPPPPPTGHAPPHTPRGGLADDDAFDHPI